MDTTKSKVENPFLSFLVSIYFLIVHLFLSLVVLSLFVAVILDNLEDPEDLKKVLQERMRKQIEYKENTRLPFRLRVYEWFKEHPKLIKLRCKTNQFATPEIKSTFMKEYLNITETELELNSLLNETQLDTSDHFKVYNFRDLKIAKHLGEFSKQIELLGDRWKELPSSSGHLSSRRKSIRFDGSALDDKNDQQLLGGKYEVKQRATSKALEVLKHYLDQRSENSVKNRLKSLEENHPLLNKSLFLIKKSNRFRKYCIAIVEFKADIKSFMETTAFLKKAHKHHRKIFILTKYSYFRQLFQKLNNLIYSLPVLDWTMIILTLICCSPMIFENPDYSILNSPEIVIIEFLFITTLCVDLGLKLIAFGLFTPDSHLFNIWFFIDLLVLINSSILLLLLEFNFEIPLIVLVLRGLRPLRFFSLIPNMKKVTYELFKGFKEYVLVFFILFFFLFISSTFALIMFGGKLKRCNDPQKQGDCNGLVVKTIKVTNLKFKDPAYEIPYRIVVPMHRSNPRNFEFDDIFNSMLALFEMLSLEGYTEVIEVVSKQVGFYAPLFIIFYLFFGLIVLTLFVGVVIENYNRNNGSALLTVDQRNYKDLKKRLKLVKPLNFPPRPKRLGAIYDLVFSQKFVNLTIFLIIFNTLLFSSPIEIEYLFTPVIRFASYFLNVFFLADTIFKLYIYNFFDYLRSRLYCLELFIFCISLVYLILKVVSFFVEIDFHEHFIKLAIIVNILRFLSLAGKHPVLRMLVLTVYTSIFYKSFFILFAQFIFVMVYAIVGVYLFANVKYGEALSRHANFKTPLFGLLTLFRVMTGEDWNKLLHDVSIDWPYCTPRKKVWEGDCGNYVYSLIYFSSFYIIITYITLNLLVAVILEQFSLFYSTNEEDLISHEDILHLQETWNLVNKNRKEKINLIQFKFFLRLLNGKFRIDVRKQNFLFKCIVCEMEKCFYNENGITFQDILQMISYRYVDCKRFLEPDEFIEREVFNYILTVCCVYLEYSIIEEVAKITIQRWLSKCVSHMKKRKELEEKVNKWRELKTRLKTRGIRESIKVNSEFYARTKEEEIIVSAESESLNDGDEEIDYDTKDETDDETERNQSNSGEFLYAHSLRPYINEAHDWFDKEIEQIDYYHFD